jgi:hypothetical protein
MHRYRISFLAGLAAGFVLGARAGRERYDQLKQLGRRVADSPAVQQAAGAVQAQAAELAKTARQRVTDELRDRVPKLGEHVLGLRHKDGSSGNGSAHAARHPVSADERDGELG